MGAIRRSARRGSAKSKTALCHIVLARFCARVAEPAHRKKPGHETWPGRQIGSRGHCCLGGWDAVWDTPVNRLAVPRFANANNCVGAPRGAADRVRDVVTSPHDFALHHGLRIRPAQQRSHRSAGCVRPGSHRLPPKPFSWLPSHGYRLATSWLPLGYLVATREHAPCPAIAPGRSADEKGDRNAQGSRACRRASIGRHQAIAAARRKCQQM